MEFWGVEVKSGKPLSVEVEENKAVHLSQVCLGEGRDKGNDPIYLYVTINEQKIMLGTLSPKKLSQQHFDLVFDKSFKLSHSWKNGTVNFIGYKCENKDEESGVSDYGSDSDSGDIPLDLVEQIKEARAAAAQQKANLAGSKKDVKEDDSSDDSHEDSSEDEQDSDEDEGSESDSSDSEAEETPKKSPVKVEKVSKKRPAESATETPGKKAKLVTPKKSGTDNKKNNVHVDTPYPSKQKAGKTSANESKQKTPESGGSHSCGPCKRSFKSDKALESHSKAKHSGEK